MSARAAVWLAWSIWALSVTFAGLGLISLFLNGSFEDLLDESLGIDAALARRSQPSLPNLETRRTWTP
jgi:hypothetical protein